MNNNRGWGLRSELWICFGMILFFVVAVILINRVFTDAKNEGVLPTKEKDDTEEVIPKKDNSTKEIKKNDNKDNNNEKEEIKNSTNYSNLEDKLVLAGSKYASKYLVSENFDDNKVVTIVRLQTEGLLDKLEINSTKCSGYIKIEKVEKEFKYYPYLKCGAEYQTTGYDVNFDNTDL